MTGCMPPRASMARIWQAGGRGQIRTLRTWPERGWVSVVQICAHWLCACLQFAGQAPVLARVHCLQYAGQAPAFARVCCLQASSGQGQRSHPWGCGRLHAGWQAQAGACSTRSSGAPMRLRAARCRAQGQGAGGYTAGLPGWHENERMRMRSSLRSLSHLRLVDRRHVRHVRREKGLHAHPRAPACTCDQ